MGRFLLCWLALGLGLCLVTLACGPTASTPSSVTPSASADAFAVVRATSQAAYQAGATALARGDYLQACVYLDTAKTTDPDSRLEIQQALTEALSRCLTPPPQPTAAAGSAQQRTIVVATVAAGVGTPLANGTPTAPPLTATQTLAAVASGGTPTPGVGAQASAATPTSLAGATAAVTATSGTAVAAAGTPAGLAGANLVTWNDPQGRFSIGAPPDWPRVDQPHAIIGTGVVGFHDTSGRAESGVAVDTSAKAVSPELYAATVELAMQQQVPGYASEQVVPGVTAGSPSVRRVFTFTQRDASGQDHQARGFQVTVVKGSTPYIISGFAPAEQYQQYSATFDQIVGSFQFS